MINYTINIFMEWCKKKKRYVFGYEVGDNQGLFKSESGYLTVLSAIAAAIVAITTRVVMEQKPKLRPRNKYVCTFAFGDFSLNELQKQFSEKLGSKSMEPFSKELVEQLIKELIEQLMKQLMEQLLQLFWIELLQLFSEELTTQLNNESTILFSEELTTQLNNELMTQRRKQSQSRTRKT